jgi:hypothetical protein
MNNPAPKSLNEVKAENFGAMIFEKRKKIINIFKINGHFTPHHR